MLRIVIFYSETYAGFKVGRSLANLPFITYVRILEGVSIRDKQAEKIEWK